MQMQNRERKFESFSTLKNKYKKYKNRIKQKEYIFQIYWQKIILL